MPAVLLCLQSAWRTVAALGLMLCIAAVACVAGPSTPPDAQRSPAASVAAQHSPIVMDGRFDDWRTVEPALVDPMDAPRSFVDFGIVRVADDPRFVHMLIDFGGEVSVQRLPGRVLMLFNVDGEERTGSTQHEMQGVDITVELTPAHGRAPDQPGMGIGLRSATYQPLPDDPDQPPLSPYDLGFTFAPTHASRIIEFRLERGMTLPETPTAFTGEGFSGKLVFLNAAGRIGDETDVFRHRFRSRTQDISAPPAMRDDPLLPPPGTFRVVSWNAEHGSMFPNPEPFVRKLRALDPDFILWQELTDEITAAQLEAFLDEHLAAEGGESWSVVYGRGGGNLRTAIASRHSLMPVEALDMLPYPDRLDRQIRVCGALAEINGRKVLMSSVHLKCCGGLDSREDNQRRTEARMINKAIRHVLAEESIYAVIVAGDFNLVGAAGTRDLLGAGLDRHGQPLRTLDVMRLDGRSNATWSDRDQPFVPGRLDYLLFTGTTLLPRGHFVLETSELPPRWLEVHGLLAIDSVAASDHRPIVADFAVFEAVGD